MTGLVIVDSGPLVALLHRDDTYHQWVRQQVNEIEAPLLTCELALIEACFLAKRLSGGQAALMGLLKQGFLLLDNRVEEHADRIADLMTDYADRPMSLTDACLIRLVETYPGATVFTLDGGFRSYRMNDDLEIPLLMPPDMV